jgi:streptomycin 6-kinase
MIGVAAVARIWELTAPALISDSPTSLVYRATQNDMPVIVKILKPRGIGEIPGMDFLRWRDGKAAVRVFAHYENAYLLEDGGVQTLLSHSKTAGARDAAFAFRDTIAALHSLQHHAPFPATLMPLEVHFQALFDRASRSSSRGEGFIFSWAAKLARELLASQTSIRPLHGDIHHQNLVAFDGNGWKVIDAKGLLGDPADDYANIFGNPSGHPDEVLDPDRCIFLAESLAHAIDNQEPARDLTPLKLLKYAAVHSALSASWSLDVPDSARDVENVSERLSLAEIIKALIDGNVVC